MVIEEFRGEYRFLSNFYIEPDGSCVEKEYQAAKCKYPQDAQHIMSALTPGIAKRLGRHVSLISDWDSKKKYIMFDFVRAKFSQEPLRSWLLATGEEKLQEGNYWGERSLGLSVGLLVADLGIADQSHLEQVELE
ncbi:unnamed protein product [marine sediment metagenome]|uniref:NADAR domain-containing protein n=1 Tax=marine sediment metagenome TaxID=412755 RepID=X1B4X2_9ZZZZ